MTHLSNPDSERADVAIAPPDAVAASHLRGHPPHAFAVEARGVRHRYGGKTVLDALDLRVPTHSTFGIFGANGAGKSTLLRLLAGIERVQQGKVSVLGHDAGQLALPTRQQIAYVSEGQQLPHWMTLSQLLAYCAPMYPSWDHELAAALQSQFDLDARGKVGAMSRGQRMKVALLCALAPRPQLLLMDEPFTGLDAAVKDDVVKGLLNISLVERTTIVFATHDILEVEPLVEHVAFLRHGRMGVAGELEALRERYRCLEFVFANSDDVPRAWPTSFTAIRRVESSGLRAIAYVDKSRIANDLPTIAARAQHVHDRPITLREMYFQFATASASQAENAQ